MTSNNFKPSRFLRLRSWMVERSITYSAWAEHLGVTKQAIAHSAKQDTMPTALHKKSLALGFPLELLPEPLDRKRSKRQPLKPYFPGLVEQEHGPAGV